MHFDFCLFDLYNASGSFARSINWRRCVVIDAIISGNLWIENYQLDSGMIGDGLWAGGGNIIDICSVYVSFQA